ncbi:chorismate synthase [Permianibacter aggregans]|uniref:Chorismate synthase n=1 Tax=Permianibacter aggregans TaxID=1510150 RepID=A0A4R6UG75_9GAMM|nr:chorismate synthase [Permianibacter aggregans]QGX41208.1 chorismate synthase [Permianibacter aggregans]TDQ45811.1 chorismate synthase [Permianibacter aggregans]
MAGDSFGTLFRISTFGESHGPGVGCIVEGCPPGLKLCIDDIQQELDRRRPGQSKISTQRKEPDSVEVLSGLLNGVTTGTPIALLIRNTDQRSHDYDEMSALYRPGHADYTYQQKYGLRDVAGGGRSSARTTAASVAAGAIAKKLLKERFGVAIHAWVKSVGALQMTTPAEQVDISMIESNPVRCPDAQLAEQMQSLIEQTRKDGDSLGGVVECIANGVPVGWGEPIFDRLEADLAKAMLAINASKGFEIGSGFAGTEKRGSEHNDPFLIKDGKVQTEGNDHGGVLGGISSGMPVVFRVAFKPTATIAKLQRTIDVDGNAIEFRGRGRHDPCVLPRAVPIVEAMAALVLADHALRAAALLRD